MTDSRVVTAGARAGYAVNGVLHLLIAVLALQIAFGGRGAKADPSGAMGLAASTPVGLVVLIAIVVGFGLLAVWQIGEVIRGLRSASPDRFGRIARRCRTRAQWEVSVPGAR